MIDSPVVKHREHKPRILVISVRGFRFQVANCSIYEFEDMLCSLEGAQLYAPEQEFPVARAMYRVAKYATRSDRIASSVSPFPTEILLENEYDFLFAVLDNPWQMHLLESIKNWRDKCRYKACYIMETWKPSFDDWRLAYEPFKNFDQIFSGTVHCVEALAKATGVPCGYLPPGVNALKFCPYPNPLQRVIDVCCVGRRSPKVHQSLFQHSQQDHSFYYYYDTVKNQNLEIENAQEHRAKLISLLQRSRYNIAAHAKFNSIKETGGCQEIGSRFFEGVAAGTVMLGTPPKGDAFLRYFDWEDAVVKVDFQQQDVLDIIQEFDAQPEKIASISRRNIVNALLKHDWVYRWRAVLATFDFKPSQAIIEREQYLQTLAHSVNSVINPTIKQIPFTKQSEQSGLEIS